MSSAPMTLNEKGRAQKMADNHSETFFARKVARIVLGVFIFLLFFLSGLSVIEQTLAVPSLAPQLFKEKVEMAWVKIEKTQKIEHVVEKSEFKIETLSEKNPPKKEAPTPKPIPKIKKKIKKEEIVDSVPVVENTDWGGEKETPRNDFGNSDDLKNQSLALIIQTIEKNKHYPRRARQMGLTGKVVLKIGITKGIVQSIDWAEKNNSEMLNHAAIAAAEKLKGKKLPFQGDLWVRVPVEFSLKGG